MDNQIINQLRRGIEATQCINYSTEGCVCCRRWIALIEGILNSLAEPAKAEQPPLMNVETIKCAKCGKTGSDFVYIPQNPYFCPECIKVEPVRQDDEEFTTESFRDVGHNMYSAILEACDSFDTQAKEIERMKTECAKAYGRITALSLQEGREKVADVFQNLHQTIDRVTAENTKLRADKVQLENDACVFRGEIERMKKEDRGIICIYCGQVIFYAIENFGDALRQMGEHDKQCQSNPLVKEIAELKADKESWFKTAQKKHRQLDDKDKENDRLTTQNAALTTALNEKAERNENLKNLIDRIAGHAAQNMRPDMFEVLIGKALKESQQALQEGDQEKNDGSHS